MKKIIALLMVVAMLFCFAGCGATDTASDSSDATNTPAQKTIVVGYTIYEPMNYFDGDKLVGYDTDLAKKVFENLGYEVIFKEIKWENKYTDLASKSIDCIWNGFTCNTADPDGVMRSEKVDFSYNYMENRQVVVVKSNSKITSAADLSGKLASVEGGSAGESYAETFEGAVIKSAKKQTDCLLEVNSGAADFAVLDAQLANSYVGKGDYANLKIIDSLTSEVEYYAVGFEKNSELTAKVNAEFEKLAAEGFMDELAAKYPKVANSIIKDFSDQK